MRLFTGIKSLICQEMRLNIEARSCLFWQESSIGCFPIAGFRSWFDFLMEMRKMILSPMPWSEDWSVILKVSELYRKQSIRSMCSWLLFRNRYGQRQKKRMILVIFDRIWPGFSKHSVILRNTGDMKKIRMMLFWVITQKILRQKRSIRWLLN